jgi:DNA-binding NarL/FixJ family response regulator
MDRCRSLPEEIATSLARESHEQRRVVALRLCDEIRRALATSPAVDEGLIARLRSLSALLRSPEAGSPGRPASPRLTLRQRQILKMIAEGRTTREMAVQLHLSVKTIESHRSKLKDLLEIRDVAGLVVYAIRSGVIDPYRGGCANDSESGNA